MAINKNHEFEELNGVKCAIVEKNVSAERVAFLKQLLEFNKYTVIVVASPSPKAAAPAPKPIVSAGENPQLLDQPSTPPESPLQPELPPAPSVSASGGLPKTMPETFTVGVTDVTFNTTNAIFGRLLRTPDKHIVTLAYWQQKESASHDEVPYYEIKS